MNRVIWDAWTSAKVAVVAMAASIAVNLQAADGTWASQTGGSWNSATNWSSGVIADGMQSSADFSTLDITSTVDVILDQPVTLGTLLFGDTDIGTSFWWDIESSGNVADTLSVTNIVVGPMADKGAAIYSLITGANALTKSGAGTLVLVNTNNYTGGTIIKEGVLQVGNNGATGSIGSGPATIASGATLSYLKNSSSTVVLPSGNDISGDGDLEAKAGTVAINGDITLGGDISLTQNSSASLYKGIDVNSSATITASSISLDGDVGQNATTRWNLGLDTSVAGGPIDLDISLGREGKWYNLGSLTADAGTGTVAVSGTRVGTENAGFRNTPVTLSGEVDIPVKVWGDNSLTVNTENGSKISGPLTGTLSLIKEGAGTLTLQSGDNTYSGPTIVSEGTLKVEVTRFDSARHFDASMLSLTNGADVTQWDDVTGYKNHATVPTSHSNVAPTYIADAGTGTGLGALDFKRNSGPSTSSALLFTSDSDIRSVFSVFKGSSFLLTHYSANNYHFHRPGDTNPTDPLWTGHTSTRIKEGQTYVNGALVDGTTYSMPTADHNGYNLVEVITTDKVIANGFNKDRTSHAGDQSHAELLLFDTVLDEEKRLEVESYLNRKWFNIGDGAGNGLPVDTAVILENDAVLDLSAMPEQTIASLSSIPGDNPRVELGSATLTVGDSNDTEFGGVIAGEDGSLIKQGSGILTLSGVNTYGGETVILGGGVLRVASVSEQLPVPGASRWFDASALTMTDGESVSVWNDLSGNAAHAVNTTGEQLPVYVNNAVNGLGAVHFERLWPNNEHGAFLEFPSDSGIRTVFSVFKGGSFLLTDSTAYHFHRPNDLFPEAPLWLSQHASANIKNGDTYVNGVAVNGQTYAMPIDKHNGFNLVEVLTANGPVTASSFNKDRVHHSGDQYHAEVIIYDRALTEEERLEIERYLLHKWFGYSLAGALPEGTPVTIGGGSTFEPGSLTSNLGTLTLTGNATIDLGNGSGVLTFEDSSAIAWTGTLTLTGTLNPGVIRFGSNGAGLTEDQINSIIYQGQPVEIDENGNLTAMPVGPVIMVH